MNDEEATARGIEFSAYKSIPLVGGPCAGMACLITYWPPNGLLELFRVDDGRIEVCLYDLKLGVDGQLFGDYRTVRWARE